MKTPKVSVLITGNEILFGKTRDTNGVFFAREFLKHGIQIEQIRVVGDFETDILKALQELFASSQFVFMTGGLGPTSDDLTANLAAKYFQLPLEFSDKAWGVCTSYFKKLGRTEIPESNKKQAFLPKSSWVMLNPKGTAAGFCVAEFGAQHKELYCLPGVPVECEHMFLAQASPHFFETLSHMTEFAERTQFVSESWQIVGLGESYLQGKLQDFETETKNLFKELNSEIAISYQAHLGYVTYTLSVADFVLNKKEHTFSFDNVHEKLQHILGSALLYRGKQTLAEKLKDTLAAKNCAQEVKEVTLDSQTSGLFSASILFKINFVELVLQLKFCTIETKSELESLKWISRKCSSEFAFEFFQKLDFPNSVFDIPNVKARAQSSIQAALIVALRN